MAGLAYLTHTLGYAYAVERGSSMRQALITIPDDLEAELDRFLAAHGESDINAVLEAALRQYLPSPRAPARSEQLSDETRPPWAIPIDALDACPESDVSVNHDRYITDAWFAEREDQKPQ